MSGVGAGKRGGGVRGERLCHNGVSLGRTNERRGAFESGALVTIGDKPEFVKEEGTEGEG